MVTEHYWNLGGEDIIPEVRYNKRTKRERPATALAIVSAVLLAADLCNQTKNDFWVLRRKRWPFKWGSKCYTGNGYIDCIAVMQRNLLG